MATQGAGSLLATRCGAELRFCRPASPSLPKRASHLRTVRVLTSKAPADGGHAPPLLEHATHHHGSTERRRTGILVGVHPGRSSGSW